MTTSTVFRNMQTSQDERIPVATFKNSLLRWRRQYQAEKAQQTSEPQNAVAADHKAENAGSPKP